MEHLWAPWRATYFLQEKPTGCFFCLNAAQLDSAGNAATDEKTFLLIRERSCFATLNAFPYTAGHMMVAPYRHTGELNDLTEDEMKDIMVLGRRCKNLIAHAFKPHGFNIGFNLGTAAGAGVADHMHLHIVPRWNGDTNFMTVLSDNRVVSEGLKETYEKLQQALREIPADPA